MRILKLRVKGLKNCTDQYLEIDLSITNRVNPEIDDEIVIKDSIIRYSKVGGFFGINAAGKTTTLEVLETAYGIYMEGERVNSSYLGLKGINSMFEDKVEIESIIHHQNDLSLVKTVIENQEIVFEEIKTIENYKKEVKNLKNLKEILNRFTFDGYNSRNINKISFEQKYPAIKNLVKEISIFNISILESKGNEQLESTLLLTDHNILPSISKEQTVVNSIISFLDDNIEYLVAKDDVEYILKFKNSEEIKTNEENYSLYLSSGTKKALYLFLKAHKVLRSGGIFIVDEIETHLNLTIIRTLISLFKDERVNKNGASIYFSSHTINVFDDFARNDNIYFLTKKSHKINVDKVEKYKLRSDKKKSNAFIAGDLGSIPKYGKYNDLRKVFCN